MLLRTSTTTLICTAAPVHQNTNLYSVLPRSTPCVPSTPKHTMCSAAARFKYRGVTVSSSSTEIAYAVSTIEDDSRKRSVLYVWCYRVYGIAHRRRCHTDTLRPTQRPEAVARHGSSAPRNPLYPHSPAAPPHLPSPVALPRAPQ